MKENQQVAWMQQSSSGKKQAEFLMLAGAFSARLYRTDAWRVCMTFGDRTEKTAYLGAALDTDTAKTRAREEFVAWVRSMTEYAPHALSILEGRNP